MTRGKVITSALKKAKNYVKKKFGDDAPKAKPKAKPKLSAAEQNKAAILKQQKNPPKAKPAAKKPATTAKKPTANPAANPAAKSTTKVQPRQLDFKKAAISSTGLASGGAGVGYLAGRDSGSTSASTKSASTKGGGGGSQRTAPKYVEPKGGNIASRTDNSDGSKVGPNMSQVNKVDAKKPAEKDSRSTMQKLFGASEEKRAMGRNQMNAARKSMGMKKGGNVKKYKKGGSIDGCAVRGHTKAKRSR